VKNILIVGAGLAGISLCERLLEKKVSVTVIDHQNNPSSTKVATGMYNPIVFKRLNKTWMIDEVLESMHLFYQHIEEKLSRSLKNEVRLFKHISSNDYRNFWNKRAEQPDFKEYLIPVNGDFGEVKKAGWVDCAAFVNHYHQYLLDQGIIQDEKFQLEDMHIEKKGITYKGLHYDSIVFCEGPFAVHNPLFDWLPFKVAKGDWVVIETEKDIELEGVVNNVVNIIPLGENRYKLSSTFEWETDSWLPNKNVIAELTDAFEEIYHIDYQIVDHQSGLRPSASDRRPYLGEHPRKKNVFIFNGLGSKGIILAPFFSHHLAEHIIDKKPILPEADIKRHLKRFQNAARLSEIS